VANAPTVLRPPSQREIAVANKPSEGSGGVLKDSTPRDSGQCAFAKTTPLAAKATLPPADLQENLTILYHPQRHPGAHERLQELLAEAGLTINQYSRASHPTEMQELVKQGCGFALIREGTVLDTDLVHSTNHGSRLDRGHRNCPQQAESS
jgi:hypothetical protein